MEMVYKLSEAFHLDRRQELFKRLSDYGPGPVDGL